jgi:molybdenum cofactor cytidylyltransferase
MSNDQIGIVILAAGESSRLGKPKQLLRFEGRTLIRRSVESALQSQAGPVLVILGSEYERVRNEIIDLPIETISNSEWKSGIASSIKCFLNKMIQGNRKVSAVIFTLCDQPYVNHETLSKLVLKYRSTGAKIVASEYEETIGVPALFDASLFEELMNLTGDSGAKSLIRRYSAEVEIISAPEAAFDIDSLPDYQRLIS